MQSLTLPLKTPILSVLTMRAGKDTNYEDRKCQIETTSPKLYRFGIRNLLVKEGLLYGFEHGIIAYGTER